MKREIAVTAATRAKLAELFDVTERCVQDCLTYRRDNDLHRRIRKAAMANGGIDLTTVPTCECVHDFDGVMLQKFDGGATLRVDKATGLAEVRDRRGRIVARAENARLSEIAALQKTAQSLK